MAVVYLAGPISDGEDPYEWHSRAKDALDDHTCINPFKLNEYTREEAQRNAREVFEEDLTAVEEADVVLLRRISGYNLCGASIEAYHAYQQGVPVVCWNDAVETVPLMLEPTLTAVESTLEDAATVVGEVAFDV